MKFAGLKKSFDGTCVLDGITAELPEHGLVGVAGVSGAGKSTLLRILAGLEQPDDGRVEGNTGRVSMQFEDDRLFPWMDVLSNVTLVGCDDSVAVDLLDSLGLADKLHARIEELSGGQRRRVALARALAFPAQVILLDEPTARLDDESAALVLDVVQRRCYDMLVIAATHDKQLIERCSMVLQV